MEEKLHRPECMPFGMYKYKPFEEIVKITEVKNGKDVQRGKQYLQWLYSQDFCKEGLKTAIKPYISEFSNKIE